MYAVAERITHVYKLKDYGGELIEGELQKVLKLSLRIVTGELNKRRDRLRQKQR